MEAKIQITIWLHVFGAATWLATVIYFLVRIAVRWRDSRAYVLSGRRSILLFLVYIFTCLILGFFFTHPTKNFVSSSLGLLIVGVVIGIWIWPILGRRAIIVMLSFFLCGRAFIILLMYLYISAMGKQAASTDPFLFGTITAAFVLLGAVLCMALISWAVSKHFGVKRYSIIWGTFIGFMVPKDFMPTSVLLFTWHMDYFNGELLIIWTALVQKTSLYLLFTLPLVLCLMTRRKEFTQATG